MTSTLKVGFVVLALVCFSAASWADDSAPEIIQVTPPGPTKYHGKALFKYPNEHPVTIVTYTQQDLEKLRQDRFMHDIKSATFLRKAPNHIPPVVAD